MHSQCLIKKLPLKEGKGGERDKEIRQPHEHVIDPATPIPGSGPNSCANEYSDEHSHQSYRHGHPATVENARQQILPEVICP
jgi:hypothetical protein